MITISHLPQLASMADTNFRVEKYSDNTTHTKLTEIKDRELYFEIARLMGVGENAQALQVAQESGRPEGYGRDQQEKGCKAV